MNRKIVREDFSFYSELAYRWAPVHHQHVNPAYVERDLLCAIDYDGDWDTSNNRRNIRKHPLIPVVYYGIAETRTHYYMLYCFYHADDATHENDLEGALLIVEKPDRALGLVALAHLDFRSYAVDRRLIDGHETVDGRLYFDNDAGPGRPMTRQDPNKHGCYSWRGAPWWMFWEPKDSTSLMGITYVPSNEAFSPRIDEIRSFRETKHGYVLLDLAGPHGFWKERRNPLTYRSNGSFNSSTMGTANPPWIWRDINDHLGYGAMFYRPAELAQWYFSGFSDDFSYEYTKRMYHYVVI
ncbi:MAG: hypothetical protein MN733_14660 [Nitrososphaera sp.]|nr:hypothetical protein [Nitrososphaera sp.]